MLRKVGEICFLLFVGFVLGFWVIVIIIYGWFVVVYKIKRWKMVSCLIFYNDD